jgi:hypothetical protein
LARTCNPSNVVGGLSSIRPLAGAASKPVFRVPNGRWFVIDVEMVFRILSSVFFERKCMRASEDGSIWISMDVNKTNEQVMDNNFIRKIYIPRGC